MKQVMDATKKIFKPHKLYTSFLQTTLWLLLHVQITSLPGKQESSSCHALQALFAAVKNK